MRRIAVALSLALVVVGCGPDPSKVTSDDVTEPSHADTKAASASWPTDVAIHRNAAGQVECPVMKDEVKSPEGKKFQDYGGKRYYFCCDGCPEAFKKDPKQYAEKNDEKVKPTDG